MLLAAVTAVCGVLAAVAEARGLVTQLDGSAPGRLISHLPADRKRLGLS